MVCMVFVNKVSTSIKESIIIEEMVLFKYKHGLFFGIVRYPVALFSPVIQFGVKYRYNMTDAGALFNVVMSHKQHPHKCKNKFIALFTCMF